MTVSPPKEPRFRTAIRTPDIRAGSARRQRDIVYALRRAATADVEEADMGRCVIVAYRPKPGREEALLTVVKKHLDVLRGEGLVSDRPGWVMRAADGTVVEVFEWRSPESIERAHSNPVVQALWDDFGRVCDYLPMAELPETRQLFAEFDTLAI
jgi:hypothetical protein